jgi:hypothetical protein
LPALKGVEFKAPRAGSNPDQHHKTPGRLSRNSQA